MEASSFSHSFVKHVRNHDYANRILHPLHYHPSRTYCIGDTMSLGAIFFLALLFIACYDTGKTIKRNTRKNKEQK